ncbi:MAG: hypothetical protein QOD06_3051 [Candidatus Binatota bacterium]|jgi:predicted amidohydrolase|nr:hypothetical protein [Candidatus Binatota bacterium]
MARLVAIAACQFVMRAIESFDDFGEHVRGLLDGARGADVVVFPELFTLELFTLLPEWRSRSLADAGEIDRYTREYRELFAVEARARAQHLLAGSHLVRDREGLLNVAHLFRPDGTAVMHAKTHIFPAESTWASGEGDAMDAIDLPFARVGINVCYEAEIPECSASLAEQGAQVLLCPSFTLSEHGFWRVRHSLQARCIENQTYAVHCCTVGGPGAPLPEGWGRSSILAPCDLPWPADGVLAQADANREGVIAAEIDLDELEENRTSGAAPTFRDRRRRSALYREWRSHASIKGGDR